MKSCVQYLIAVWCAVAALLGGAFYFISFAPFSSGLGPEWYLDFAGRRTYEIQDQDLFFHNIGRSIEAVRQADIVVLGSSLASFAFDRDTMRRLIEKQHGLRFYNMAFVGIASGEFSRLVVKKHRIQPRMWIINADDGGGGGNFFSQNTTRAFGADTKQIAALGHSRLRAMLEVQRRRLLWDMEEFAESEKTGFVHSKNFTPRFYRNEADGGADMSLFPGFLSAHNGPVRITRTICHTTPQAIAIARQFIEDIGGIVVLTTIPNLHYCEMQAREIAEASGVELILPGKTDYSSWDGGGHLDKRGAEEMTADFVQNLENSESFRKLGRSRPQGKTN